MLGIHIFTYLHSPDLNRVTTVLSHPTCQRKSGKNRGTPLAFISCYKFLSSRLHLPWLGDAASCDLSQSGFLATSTTLPSQIFPTWKGKWSCGECLRNQIKPKQDSEGFTVFHSLTSKIGWLGPFLSHRLPIKQQSAAAALHFFQQTAAVNIKGISSRSGTRCFLKKGPHLKQQSLRFKKLLCQTGDVAFEALKGSLHNTAERKD